MPEVMAKFLKKKKGPGQSNKKRDRYVKVLEMVDQCCGDSMITTAALELIEHRVLVEEAESNIRTVTTPAGEPHKGRVVEFEQFLPNEEEPMTVRALEVPTITTSPARSICLPERYCNAKLGDDNPRPDREVGVLLGQPHVNRVIKSVAVPLHPGESGDEVSQYVIETAYGLVFTGKFPMNDVMAVRTHFVGLTGTERIANLLEAGWRHDELSDSQSTLTVEEEEARRRIEDTLTYDEDKQEYTASFLFRNPEGPVLEDNYSAALDRWNKLAKRFKREPIIEENYDEKIQQMLDDGMIEEVTDFSKDSEKENICYLAHHVVINQESLSTKYRVCLDPTLKMSHGESFNDQLLAGPKLQRDNVEILVPLRTEPIILKGDVKQMFLRIKLREDCQDMVRFLYKPKEEGGPPVVLRLKTVYFGFRDAPFVAQYTLNHHAKKIMEKTEDPKIKDACEQLLQHTYVDDILMTAPNVELAKQRYDGVQEILKSANMVAKKWVSNHPEVVAYIPEEYRAPVETVELAGYGGSSAEEEMVSSSTTNLGTRYKPGKDVLTYDHLPQLKDEVKYTMTSIASLVAKAGYDPYGLISPHLIPLRCLIKECWKRKIKWTQTLDEDLKQLYDDYVDDLKNFDTLEFQRYVPFDKDTSQLHVFCDASSSAGYGMTVYVRTPTDDGWDSNLLLSRSRINPMKEIDIHRLELKAMHYATTITKILQDILDMKSSQITIWSDSNICLWWLTKKKQLLRQYESNRIGFCQESLYTYRKIGTSRNPSDLNSRGCKVEQLKSEFYQKGPEYLRWDEELWPQEEGPTVEQGCILGLKPQNTVLFTDPRDRMKEEVLVIRLKPGPWVICKEENVPIIEYKQNYYRILRITATVIKACRLFLRGKRTPKKTVTPPPPIDMHDLLEEAERYWIKQAQKEAFKEEIRDLRKGECVSRKSPLRKYFPYLDQFGVLRVGGRLCRTDLQEDVKHPQILPKGTLSSVILKHSHLATFHHNTTTFAEVSKNYEILGCHGTLKNIQGRCIACRRLQARNARTLQGQLPPERVMLDTRPFQYCSMDTFGPLYLLPYRRKNKQEPRPPPRAHVVHLWGCMVTRAFHLEIADDKSSESYLLAFRRFCAKNSVPQYILADNSKEFNLALRIKDDVITQFNDKMKEESEKLKFKYEQNPIYHAHFNGLHETLVRAAKHAIFKAFGNQLLTVAECQTSLDEIQNTLNGRPLCQTNPGSTSFLTPNHLLKGDVVNSFPPMKDIKLKEKAVTAELIKQKASKWEHYHKTFWKTFRRMYLDKLRVFHKNAVPKEPLFEGQLVLIDSLFKRTKFKLGVIEGIKTNRSDDQVRTVKLRVNTDHGVDRWEAWPATRIVPLEVEKPLKINKIGEQRDTPDTNDEAEVHDSDNAQNESEEDNEGQISEEEPP